jgi:hypothetical protein
MLNVHLITPVHGNMRPELALFRESLAANEKRFALTLSYSDGQPVANNRNHIVQRFLERDGDYLCMIDSDNVPLFNPLDYVERDLDVIGFPYPTWRGNDEYPIRWFPHEPTGNGVVEIDEVGTGCILIAHRVLVHPDMRAPFMDEWDRDGLRTIGEDQSFCRRARKVGFRVFCDTSRICAHFKTLDVATLWRYINGR